MTTVTEAAAELATWLPVAALLTAQPDLDGSHSHAEPRSKPPGNVHVTDTVYRVLEALRRLRADLLSQVTDAYIRQPRPIAQTGATLKAIASLSHALDHDQQQHITRQLVSYVILLKRLPAIGEEETWRKITGAICCYCTRPMLLLSDRSTVTCLAFGLCFDEDGNHPFGFMTVGDASGQPMIAWADGNVQMPPPEGTDDETAEA